MKLNRIMSFAIITMAVVVVLGQAWSNGVQAAPSKYKAEGSAQISQPNSSPAQPASSNKPAAPNQPTDQTTYHINVQGRLTNGSGGPLPAGTYNMTFNIYQAPNGGGTYYTDGPVPVNVDEGGLFTYQLGTATPISLISAQLFSGKLYIGIKINGDPEMVPRFEFNAAAYALSLNAGAVVRGSLLEQTQPWFGVLNVINDDNSDAKNAGLFGQGPLGVYGRTQHGVGVRGETSGSLSFEQGAGVIGINNDVADNGIIAGGVFTATGPNGWAVVAYGGQFGSYASGHAVEGFNDNPSSVGLGGNSTGDNGIGVVGSGYDNIHHRAGSDSSMGGQFSSYDNDFGHLGLQVNGFTQSFGGYQSTGPLGITTIYNGNAPLHPGDVVALDGNNATLMGGDVLGTVKATSADSPIIGVVAHRFKVSTAPLQAPEVIQTRLQIDDATTSFHAGDYLQVIVMGAVRLPLSQPASVGDRLTLSADGSLALASAKAVTNSSAITVGRIASTPDNQGLSLVYVNFK